MMIHPLHLLLTLPAFEPSDTVLPRTIEYITTVHAFVIVEQDHITLFHLNKLYVLHCDLVNMLKVGVANLTIIAIEDVRFVYL